MEKELSSAELYKKDRSKFYERERNVDSVERKRLGDYERFEANSAKITIFRGLGETHISEDYGTKKLRFPGCDEIEVDHFLTQDTIIPTPMTSDEEAQRNEEIFQILDRRSREDLKNAYVLR